MRFCLGCFVFVWCFLGYLVVLCLGSVLGFKLVGGRCVIDVADLLWLVLWFRVDFVWVVGYVFVRVWLIVDWYIILLFVYY